MSHLKRTIPVKVPKVSVSGSQQHVMIWQIIMFVTIFAGIGGFFIYRSSAATPVVASIQGEKMSQPYGASVISDGSASGGQALKLTRNGSASADISLPTNANNVVVSARGSQCNGSPTIKLDLDGTNLVSGSVTTTSFANFSSSTGVNPGSHTVTITGGNLGNFRKNHKSCTRSLYIDITTFYGPDVSAAPTVTLSASPVSVALGSNTTLVWSSTNATACTASGSWSGAKATSGSEIVTPSTSSQYTIACSGNGGGATTNTNVTVNAPVSATPSGQAIPTGPVTSDNHVWTPIASEDFNLAAPLGSWGSDCDASKIVYTGATGTQWRTYPKCYLDTFNKRPYRSDQVLSVHDGSLDYWLHPVDGKPAGANPSPVLPGGTNYQTYGRYTARIKQTTAQLSDYYMAWLLWPENDSDYQCAESDFPEGGMGDNSVSAYSHYGCAGSQQIFNASVDKTQWHTYTQEWLPGKRNYYIDGNLVGTATNQIWTKPQRWQMQTETNSSKCETTAAGCTQSGNLLVDWVVVYKY